MLEDWERVQRREYLMSGGAGEMLYYAGAHLLSGTEHITVSTKTLIVLLEMAHSKAVERVN
jgi:hypothetical protein